MTQNIIPTSFKSIGSYQNSRNYAEQQNITTLKQNKPETFLNLPDYGKDIH